MMQDVPGMSMSVIISMIAMANAAFSEEKNIFSREK
jgi:hypothetical protein